MSEIKSLFDFIKKSPTAFHAVDTLKKILLDDGYTELFESDRWELCEGEKYFTVRNGSSLIAFRNNSSAVGFMIAASHSDTPSFRLKMSGELNGAYTRLDTEKYGGVIYRSWLDRPLSLAGRVVVSGPRGVDCQLVDLECDLAVIPDVAIHFNRGVNDSGALNPAVDMLPLCGGAGSENILSKISAKLGISKDSVISHDLFLYNREEGRLFGTNEEFILCPRLDDLSCVYASARGFLTARGSSSVPVLAVFDNEEVGSQTKQGAASTFLSDTLKRIAGDDDNYRTMLSCSFMVSADNAHALHPNHPELSDKSNAPLLNGGVVIKFNSSQRYATDGSSHGIFETICKRAGAKTQIYYTRADMVGGTTLGSIADTCVSVPTVDIGLAQLAMHSACETAGALDLDEMIKALREFYSTAIIHKGDKYVF